MPKKIAKRDNEQLWEYCKNEAVEKMGKFSARAMQYAVKLYKERGGGYVGEKSKDNSLAKWTKEDWGYTGAVGHSRYLPKEARAQLTVGEKIATDRAKKQRHQRKQTVGQATIEHCKKDGEVSKKIVFFRGTLYISPLINSQSHSRSSFDSSSFPSIDQ